MLNYYKITVEELDKLNAFLEQKNWFDIDVEEHPRLLEKFANTLSMLNKDEKELFYLLCSDFMNIHSIRFDSILRKIVRQIPRDVFVDREKIYVVPVVTAQDNAKFKSKSGQMIVHMLKSILDDKDELEGKKIEYLSSPEGLDCHMARDKSLIIFCDDFIGSSRQFFNCNKAYSKYAKISDSCIIITLSILKEGYDKLTQNGLPVFCEKICYKGISENSNICHVDSAKALMENVETRINVPQKYCFGFKKSEALIAINQRAPNNTFPIFWWPRKHKTDVLFPRS